MRLDPLSNSLTFDSRDELEAFHAEVSTLMREVTIAASGSSADAAVATARAREVLDRFATVTAMLNAVRTSGAVKRRVD
jgi:hypothetical protein